MCLSRTLSVQGAFNYAGIILESEPILCSDWESKTRVNCKEVWSTKPLCQQHILIYLVMFLVFSIPQLVHCVFEALSQPMRTKFNHYSTLQDASLMRFEYQNRSICLFIFLSVKLGIKQSSNTIVNKMTITFATVK